MLRLALGLMVGAYAGAYWATREVEFMMGEIRR